ncbi:putative N-acetyltransferase YhbS OS=Ureibacillus acetophenoni OX=614649 GN=SAMN05877842_1183 PE=4 SV=1 [Ureibacillus acetophenoni]
MIIRDALPTEFAKVKEIRLAAYEEHAGKVPESHWNALKQQIIADEDTPGIETIVAEVDGEIVGTAVLYPAETSAYQGLVDNQLTYPELRKLAVSDKARGKGVAKALIQECINRAKKKGYASMGLHTADYMETAMKLYEKIGFVRTPEEDFIPLEDGIVVKAFRITF